MTYRDHARHARQDCSHIASHAAPLAPAAAAAAMWDQRLQQRVPLQYLTASAFWRDVVLSGDSLLVI